MAELTRQSKRWTWTLNNYTEAHLETMKSLKMNLASVEYVCFGQEIAPTTGMRHLQGYLELTKKQRGRTLKDSIGIAGICLFSAKGSGEQNKTYCSKEGIFFEDGVMQVSAPGKRSDLDDVVESIKNGSKMRELWLLFPKTMIRCERGILRCFQELSPHSVSSVPKYSIEAFDFWSSLLPIDFSRSIVFWGSAGIGKTCFARAIMPTALLVSHMDDLLKFVPDIHEGIIFDDMDFQHIPRTAQIHLVDIDNDRSIHCRYQAATIPANTRKIFTTNNYGGYIFLPSDSAIGRRVQLIHLIK